MVPAQETSCPDPDPDIGNVVYHELVFFQGDDPSTDSVEPAGMMKAIDTSRWMVPWNASHLFVSVPEGASNLDMTNLDFSGAVPVTGRFESGDDTGPQYSLVTEGDHAGFYRWEFPEDAPRDYTANLLFNSTQYFETHVSDQTDEGDWDTGNDTLSLNPGVLASNFTTKMESVGYDMVAATISLNTSSGADNITFFMSADNGTTWVEMGQEARVEFPGIDSQMKFMIHMEQNTGLNNTPVINSISMILEYIPENLDIWIETTYEMDIPDDGLIFSFHLTYDLADMPLYYIGYFDDDMVIAYEGMEVSATTFESMPNKTIHMTMAEDHESCLAFHIVPPGAGQSGFDMAILITIIFVAILTILAFYFMKKNASAKKETGKESGSDDEAAGDESGEDEDSQPPEGVDAPYDRKKVLEDIITRIDSEALSGMITAQAAARMKSPHEKELAQIEEESGETAESVESTESADSALSEANEAREALEIRESLEARKSELIGKLKDLDTQLADGEITGEDHEILKASYKKKTIEIMKELDRLN
ncbi:MAG: hypothetical protein KAS67_02640 [Thermoplasmata archaeon]|nr:hypothetical protein [Thermoplasmata archaeon]